MSEEGSATAATLGVGVGGSCVIMHAWQGTLILSLYVQLSLQLE